MIHSVTNLLSGLTVIGNIISIGILIALVGIWIKKPIPKFLVQPITLAARRGLFWAWIVALISMSGSLFFSDIAGYDPCKLCWLQRILMYPQVLLLGIASFRKDKNIISYILPFTIMGMGLSLYHYVMQIYPQHFVPCSTVGYSVSCSEKFFLTFGYITIPMMAFTAFTLITGFLLLQKYNENL